MDRKGIRAHAGKTACDLNVSTASGKSGVLSEPLSPLRVDFYKQPPSFILEIK